MDMVSRVSNFNTSYLYNVFAVGSKGKHPFHLATLLINLACHANHMLLAWCSRQVYCVSCCCATPGDPLGGRKTKPKKPKKGRWGVTSYSSGGVGISLLLVTCFELTEEILCHFPGGLFVQNNK